MELANPDVSKKYPAGIAMMLNQQLIGTQISLSDYIKRFFELSATHGRVVFADSFTQVNAISDGDDFSIHHGQLFNFGVIRTGTAAAAKTYMVGKGLMLDVDFRVLVDKKKTDIFIRPNAFHLLLLSARGLVKYHQYFLAATEILRGYTGHQTAREHHVAREHLVARESPSSDRIARVLVVLRMHDCSVRFVTGTTTQIQKKLRELREETPSMRRVTTVLTEMPLPRLIEYIRVEGEFQIHSGSIGGLENVVDSIIKQKIDDLAQQIEDQFDRETGD